MSQNVPYVSWSLYRTISALGPSQYDTAQPGLGSQSSSTSEDDSSGDLQRAALRLRHHGLLVHYDHEYRVLLLFDIPPNSSTAFNVGRGDPERLTKDCGLKISQSGQLFSKSLDSSSSGSFANERLSSERLQNMTVPDCSTKAATSEDSIQTRILYRAFNSAILSTIVHRLVQNESWIHFGTSNCIRTVNDPWYASVKYVRLSQVPAHSVEHLCFDVRWLPTGSLVIFGRWKYIPGLASLSKVLQASGTHDVSSSMIGQQALLLPLGIPCEFVCLENRLPDRFGSIDNSKALVTSWLLHHGYQLGSTTKWVCLRCTYQISPDDPSDAYRETHIWWPAHLCLIIQPAQSLAGDEVLQEIADGKFVDPIAKAEQWLLASDARAKALLAKQQEDKARVRGDNQASDVAQDNQGTIESPNDPVSWTGQYLSAQEASGIYPTPPDGIISHSQGSFTAHDTPADFEHDGQGIGISANGATIESSDHAFLGMQANERAIEEDEAQDLFGDMDTEMFGNNDLTEADFNFFDEVHDGSNIVEPPNDSPPKLNLDASVDREEIEELDESTTMPLTIEQGVIKKDLESADRNKTPLSPSSSPQVKPKSGDTQHELPTHQGSSSGSDSDNDNPDGWNEPEATGIMQSGGKQSFFKNVPFNHRPPYSSDKYGLEGRYATDPPKATLGEKPGHRRGPSNIELPMIGPLSHDSDSSSSHSESALTDAEGFIDWDDEKHSTSRQKQLNANKDDETTTKSSRKRRREPSSGSDEPDGSVNSLLEQFFDRSQEVVPGLLNFQSGQDVENYLSEISTTSRVPLLGQGEDIIRIAQLVADQRVLRHGEISPVSATKNSHDDKATSFDFGPDILSELLPGMTQCALEDFLEFDTAKSTNEPLVTPSSLSDTAKRHQGALASYPTNSQDEGLFRPKLPFLRVDRGEDAMNIATPALYFWEELGLGPSGHSKDIEAHCIFPSNEAIRDAALAFLTGIESSYQGCKFGRHQRGSASQSYKDGLVPVKLQSADPDDVCRRYREKCDNLGAELPVVEADGTNYAVYVIDPFNDEAMLPHLCAGFLQLSATFAARIEKAGISNARGLVLQVVPICFLANHNTITIPPPSAYRKLAFEVYGRCPPTPGVDGNIPPPHISGSAIHFAKPIPKSINFHLGPQTRDNLLFPDPVLHLAYSWVPTQQWLACAWTDNLGDVQWHAVYCLGLPEPDFWDAFLMTVKEILETTLEILDEPNCSARLCVVKDGTMYQREIDAWQNHSSIHPKSLTMTLLSITINPPLSFPPMKPNLQMPEYSAASPTITSPNDHAVSTPDQLPSPALTTTPGRSSTNNLPGTPSAPTSGFTDHDSSARLVDIVSQTWCFISPIPIPDPYLHAPHLAPVAMSGYILKRRGTDEEDGLVSLGVNLIALDVSRSSATSSQKTGSDNGKTQQEKMLREVLGMYSDLAHLARLRGTEEWKEGVLPWHVAAARKAVGAVRGCMRWG
ncbi:MAG: hypothetical protein Q9220_000393 [cf. Caloplaca sp. 1 TL-2023]